MDRVTLTSSNGRVSFAEMPHFCLTSCESISISNLPVPGLTLSSMQLSYQGDRISVKYDVTSSRSALSIKTGSRDEYDDANGNKKLNRNCPLFITDDKMAVYMFVLCITVTIPQYHVRWNMLLRNLTTLSCQLIMRAEQGIGHTGHAMTVMASHTNLFTVCYSQFQFTIQIVFD